MKLRQFLKEGQENPTKEFIKDAVGALEKELDLAISKSKKIGHDALNSILGNFKKRLEGAVIMEDGKDEKALQALSDKAEKDVNADWDPPSKKQLPLNEKEVDSLIIKITFGNDAMQSSEDAEVAIKTAFKKYRAGSGGAKFVNIYDENGNKVGSLEVK